MKRETFIEQLNHVQKNVNLAEGLHGLIRVLALIDRIPGTGTKILSQKSNLPVPLVVAIINEFLSVGWCKRAYGNYITDKGKEVIETLGGTNRRFICTNCNGYGYVFPLEQFTDKLTIYKKYTNMRGKPDTTIDQSFATAETSLKRVLFMIHNYDLFISNCAFIGDSDLTSIVLALFAPKDIRITVFDIDVRIRKIIEQANSDLDLNIEFVEHNLREPIPSQYQKKYSCINTDPPYTINGCDLFVSRALDLVDKKLGGTIYLSFVNKPPLQMLDIQKTLVNKGCLITHIIPRFNEYIGAQKIGGVSTLFRMRVQKLPIQPIDFYDCPIYTGQKNPLVKFYRCKNCGTVIKIGVKKNIKTIEELKKTGCNNCGAKTFLKIKEEKVI